MLNYCRAEFDKMTKDQSFKSYKRQNLKVDNKLVKLDGEKTSIDRTIISKILKLNEKNQYGYAMTKLLPTRCIIQLCWKGN